MTETPGSRKKRLKDETKKAKTARASAPKVKPEVFTGSIDSPVKPKKEAAPKPKVTKEDLQEKVTASQPKPAEPIVKQPVFTDTTAPTPNTDAAFAKKQKEKDLSEIGEATYKYNDQLSEIPFSDTPREKVTSTPDPLRPKLKPEVVAPTPAEEARKKGSGSLPAGIGSGKASPLTFNSAPGAPVAPNRDVSQLVAKREAKGLEGLPGDEEGYNSFAVQLAKKDHAIAKQTGKAVNGISPEDEEPTAESVYYGHHRRLAEVILDSGVNSDQIKKAAAGTGATVERKVSYLHKLLKDNKKASAMSSVDHKSEGVTHWIHPTTGVAHAIADNHPDMPKMVNPDTSEVTPAFSRAGGAEDRVRRDENTNSWVLDRRTGDANIDQTLKYDNEKPIGWNAVTLRGGVKAYKANQPTPGSRSLWHHEINNMKGDFPQSVSQDSRVQHKTISDTLMTQMAARSPEVLDSGPDAATRGHGARAIGIKSTGRTKPRGFAVTPTGEASPASATVTSRARVTRPASLTPTSQFGDDGYAHGGSVLETNTTEAQEWNQVTSPDVNDKLSRDRLSAKTDAKETRSANINAAGALTSAPRGSRKAGPREVLVEKRGVLPKGRQFTAVLPPTPAPRWATPGSVTDSRDGVSTAEPIKKGRGSVTERIIPEPKAAKKNPKTGKMARKLDYHPGLVDQELPGMQFAGAPKVKAEDNPIIPLEGPLTKLQTEAIPGRLASNFETVREGAERFPMITTRRALDKEAKVAPAPLRMSSSTQLAKVPGNKPATVPQSVPESGGKKTKIKNQWAVDSGLADTRTPKAEQLSFSGMENVGSFHATGQQWVANKDLSETTKTLQGQSRAAGVPGGTNPVQVERGTERPKSSGSFKNKK